MAYETGTATDYRDLLNKLLHFLESRATPGTPVYTGTGNGQLLDLDGMPQAPAETWTLECSNATKVGAADYGAVVLGSSPIVFWRFNETVGVVAEDATANNVDGNSAGHRFWRIYITANNGNSVNVAITEVELRGTPGGTDLTGLGFGSLIYSSQFADPIYFATGAFDNNNSTRWGSADNAYPQWIGYDFGVPVDIREVALTAPYDVVNKMAKSFEIQYSDDGANWTVGNTFTNEIGWTLSEQRTYSAYSGAVLSSVTMSIGGLLSVDTDTAYQFDGGFVASLPVSAVQATGDASLELIVQPSSTAGTQFIAGVVSGGSGNTSNALISLRMVDGYLQIVHEYGTGNTQTRTTAYQLSSGRKYHLVLSRDAAAKTYQLIVGGVVQHEYTYLFPASDGTSSAFLVGCDAELLYPFHGVIDEVALYNVKLSAATARTHAEAALGHETVTVTGSVSAAQGNAIVGLPYQNDYIEFLIEDGAIDFVVGDDWSIAVTAGDLGAQRWQINRREYDKVFLQASGLAGTDEVFVQIRTFEDAATDYFNWQLTGSDGYHATLDIEEQLNVSPKGYFLLWNSNIPYHFVANGRRFAIVAKISTTQHSCYAGLVLTTGALPIQFPYPIAIGAETAISTLRWSDGSDDVSCPFDPRSGALYLRHPGGEWLTFKNYHPGYDSSQAPIKLHTHPFSSTYGFSLGGITDLELGGVLLDNEYHCAHVREGINGEYELESISFIDSGANNNITHANYGEFEGIYFISGFANAAENTVLIDGKTYLVVQDVFRSENNNYFAVELD